MSTHTVAVYVLIFLTLTLACVQVIVRQAKASVLTESLRCVPCAAAMELPYPMCGISTTKRRSSSLTSRV